MNNKMSLKKATIINAGSKYSVVIINLIITAILARLLTPEDYGVVAITTVFTNFFSIFADMGLGTGIIQDKTLTDKDNREIFSFCIFFALFIGAVFVLFSRGIAVFYKNDIYISIGILLAVNLFFNTLNIVPNALIMKNMEFISMAIRNIVICVVTGIVAIVLAFWGYKYYAIVWQSLLAAIITFGWNYFTASKKYGLKLILSTNSNGVKKILSFSSYQLAFGIVNYFSRNLDNLIISRFFGEKMLGYYDKAYKLMCYPMNILSHAITPVLHPVLSVHQDDCEYILKKYIKIVQMLSVIGVVVTGYCFLAGEEIIFIMFGEQWKESIPCFRVLSFSVWAQIITATTGAIFQSTGNTKTLFKVSLINTLMTVIALIIGLKIGNIFGVAASISCAYQLHFVIAFYFLLKTSFKRNLFYFLKQIYLDLLLLGGVLVCCMLFPINIEELSVLGRAVVKAAYIFGIYVIGLLLTNRIELIKSFLKK